MSAAFAEHDPLLVTAALGVAAVGALAGLFTGRYVRDPGGRLRLPWLALCAVVLATCMMWAAHFVAVLAWEPGVAMTFGVERSVLSLAMPAIFTVFAVLIVTRHPDSPAVLAVGALVMTMGLVALHYGGMAALRLPFGITHAPRWVLVSLAAAFALSLLALHVLVRVEGSIRYASVLLMAAAVGAMHFSGMAGLRAGAAKEAAWFTGAITPQLMALVVSAVALVTAIVGVALGALGYLERGSAREPGAVDGLRGPAQ